MMTKDLLVVLVNWKRADDTILCIQSLFENSNLDFVISICDNASEDGSSEKIRSFLSCVGSERYFFSEIDAGVKGFEYIDSNGDLRAVFVQNSLNAGFAAGNNLAYRAAIQQRKFLYTWFLNNDTEIASGCVEALMARMKSDSRIGICGATLVFAHDRKTVQALGGASYSFFLGSIKEVGNSVSWPCAVDQFDVEQRLSYISGASMFVSHRFLLEVGLMKEDYFIFFEELDWSARAHRAGFRLGYAKDAVVYHKEGASIGTGKAAVRSALAEFYGLRNKLLFTWRFVPWAFPSVWVVSWLQVGRRIVQGRFDRALLMARTLVGLGAAPSPK